MGGNAIKKNGESICGRLQKAQYEIIKEYILSIMRKYFHDLFYIKIKILNSLYLSLSSDNFFLMSIF